MMMLRSKDSLAAAAKEKVVNNTQNIPPLVDDGRDDIETAVANNNTIHHSPTLPLKNKGSLLYRSLRGCNLWMFLAIASVGLHFYRNLQTINNIPTSERNDMPVEMVSNIRDPSKSKKNILYIVRSFEDRYESHLRLQVNSWMQHLHPEYEAILIASQFSDTEYAARDGVLVNLPNGVEGSFSAPKCPHNNHGMGLCCQEANALVAAAQERRYSSFDWVFVIDEDVFVSPTILQEVVNDYNESDLVSIGTKGCVAKEIGGFCGGGGYLISRPALERTVALTNFMSQYMKVCSNTDFCDIATSSLLETANVTTLTDGRFHPWGIPKEELPFSNISIFKDESYPGVAYRFILQQRSSLLQNQVLIPKRSDMFTHLLKHPEIVRSIVSPLNS